jgi:alanine racemase
MPRSRVITGVRGGSRIRPTRVEVDLAAICHNAARLGRLAGPVYAVVKADAYGHGAPGVARALERAGEVHGLAVSLVEEAAELREAGIRLPILVMGPSIGTAHDELVALDATPLVSERVDLEAFAAVGRRRGSPVAVHLKIDTGMSRLGLDPELVPGVIERARLRGDLEITGLATHLACADVDDPSDAACMTHAQLRRFRDVVTLAHRAGAGSLVVHAANSSAALRFPAARLDVVRPGLALYGGGPAAPDFDLLPTTRLVSEIVQLREVRKGASVSYNALWRAERDTRVAVLPIGYADGYPRRLSSDADVLIRGRRCPVVGAVSMDIAIVDVTDLGPNVNLGDESVLLGAQGNERISLAEFAQRAGLIEHEVTCGISKRVPRVYR